MSQDAGIKRSREQFTDTPDVPYRLLATVSQDVFTSLIKALGELHKTSLMLQFGTDGSEEPRLIVPWRIEMGSVGCRGALSLLSLDVEEDITPEERLIVVQRDLLLDALKMLQRVDTIVMYRATDTPHKLTIKSSSKDFNILMHVPLMEYDEAPAEPLGKVPVRWQFNVQTHELKVLLSHVSGGQGDGAYNMQIKIALGNETPEYVPAVLTFTNEDVETTRACFSSDVRTVLKKPGSQNGALTADASLTRATPEAYTGLEERFNHQFVVKELHKVLEKVTCQMITMSITESNDMCMIDIPIGASKAVDGDITGLTIVLCPRE